MLFEIVLTDLLLKSGGHFQRVESGRMHLGDADIRYTDTATWAPLSNDPDGLFGMKNISKY